MSRRAGFRTGAAGASHSSVNVYSCCPPRVTGVFLAPVPTTSSKSTTPGEIVRNEIDPSAASKRGGVVFGVSVDVEAAAGVVDAGACVVATAGALGGVCVQAGGG